MNTKKKNGRFSLFGLLVTVLSLLLVILVIVAVIRSTPKKYEYSSQASYILSDLKNGHYADALSKTAENRAMGIDERNNADYAAPYAACDYFEACTYYEAFLKLDDKKNASVYEAKMAEAYERMGSLQFMAEEIRAALRGTTSD